MYIKMATLWYGEDVKTFPCLLVDDRIQTDLDQMDWIYISDQRRGRCAGLGHGISGNRGRRW